MKNISYLMLFTILIYSCEPVAREGTNPDLPPVLFGFKVSPDTAYLKVGDTVTLYSSISSTLSNGVKLNDGNVYLDASLYYFDTFPITNSNAQLAVNAIEGIQYDLIKSIGDIKENTSNPGSLWVLLHHYKMKPFLLSINLYLKEKVYSHFIWEVIS